MPHRNVLQLVIVTSHPFTLAESSEKASSELWDFSEMLPLVDSASIPSFFQDSTQGRRGAAPQLLS